MPLQTGSGKTFTMAGSRDDPGISPRVVEAIFRAIEEAPDTMEFTIRVSYLEIYMEVRPCPLSRLPSERRLPTKSTTRVHRSPRSDRV
jgi:hypothetical protein